MLQPARQPRMYHVHVEAFPDETMCATFKALVLEAVTGEGYVEHWLE